MHDRRGSVRAWLAVWISVALLPALVPGCRALTSGQTNKPLVSARQLSLRGADALQRGRDQDAELLFSQSLALSPLDERAHWGYATTLWNRGDKERATFHMTEALRLSERNPEYAIRLGEMYLELGNYADAKNIALDVLSANRNHSQAWALLGDTHRAESDWDDARECYHRALLIRRDYPKVQLAIAELYRKTGRPQRALSTLDRMTDLNATIADNPEHMLLRGLAFADLNRPQEAASLLAECSEHLPPERWQQQLEVAETQCRIGEMVQARMTMGRIVESHANEPAVLHMKHHLDQHFSLLAENPSLPNSPLPNPTLADPSSFPRGSRNSDGTPEGFPILTIQRSPAEPKQLPGSTAGFRSKP